MNFYKLSQWTQKLQMFYAMNSTLTWFRIFKFLNYFPQMHVRVAH